MTYDNSQMNNADETRTELCPLGVREFEIDKITFSKTNRMCSVELEDLRSVEESIRRVGMMQPLGITEDGEGIYGFTRFKACKNLGIKTVSCVVYPANLTLQQRKLIEIDENLMRRTLKLLQLCEHHHERKLIYEELYPQTRAGGARRKGDKKAKRNDCVDSYAASVAGKTGVSRRTVETQIRIWKKLDPEVKELIRGTDFAESVTKLSRLAELPAEEQKLIAARITENNSGADAFVTQFDGRKIAQTRTDCRKDGNKKDAKFAIHTGVINREAPIAEHNLRAESLDGVEKLRILLNVAATSMDWVEAVESPIRIKLLKDFLDDSDAICYVLSFIVNFYKGEDVRVGEISERDDQDSEKLILDLHAETSSINQSKLIDTPLVHRQSIFDD